MTFAIGILMITNLFVVGCMHFAYAKAGKYENNMVLGVTLSGEQFSDKDVQNLVNRFKNVFKKTIIIGYVTAVLINIPMKWYVSIWLILYLLWMFGYIAVIELLHMKYHKKLYDIKKQKGFTFGTAVYEVTVDTRLSQLKNKMPVSKWWFVLAFIPVLVPLTNDNFRKHMTVDLETFGIIYGVIFFTKFAYIHMYYLFGKKRSQVYSKDSEINIACNRIAKRGYSIIFVVASLVDSLSFFLLLWDEMSMGYMTEVSLILFFIMQMGIVSGLVYGMYSIKKKVNEILKQDKERYIVDEDEFWKNGYYYNPKDNRLFVQDRQNGMNMTFNMAKKASWIITMGIGVGTLAMLVWTSVLTLRLDFVETRYEIGENLYINAPSYGKVIGFDEIKSVKLLDELPEVKMSKQSGAATDKYSLGKFRVRNQGICYLYIYKGYSPIIEVETEDMKIYFNSREEGVIEKCYQELLENVEKH